MNIAYKRLVLFIVLLLPALAFADPAFEQIGVKYDATANDSNKSWVVPANQRWKIASIHVSLASTATVGNRQLKMEVLDTSNNLHIDSHAGAVQAASATYHYEFMQGVYRETSFIDSSLQVPIPIDTILLPGWTLKIYDETAVDAAADDMTISFTYFYDN